ncbi:MAG TPA: redoxin domain-containing protein [Terriglobia bacterium]
MKLVEREAGGADYNDAVLKNGGSANKRSRDTLWLARVRHGWVALWVVGLLATGAGAAESAAQRVRLLDLKGREVEPLTGTDARATVFVFTRTDCPISNRYAPEVQRIYYEFASVDVAFWLVYVDPEESVAVIRRHLNDYAYPFGALFDPQHQLVRLTGVRVTPEVAVFVSGGAQARMVYRGRIDDKYVELDKERPQPTTHDLENVLRLIVEGKPVKSETTRAVGCFISDLEAR